MFYAIDISIPLGMQDDFKHVIDNTDYLVWGDLVDWVKLPEAHQFQYKWVGVRPSVVLDIIKNAMRAKGIAFSLQYTNDNEIDYSYVEFFTETGGEDSRCFSTHDTTTDFHTVLEHIDCGDMDKFVRHMKARIEYCQIPSFEHQAEYGKRYRVAQLLKPFGKTDD